jgi:hydrogenase maturation protease
VRWLVIGYGSDLRGDDALGPRAAAAVASWQRPDVQVLSVHQLTPELAEPLAAADRALFLDAHPADAAPHLRIRHLTPSLTDPGLGHTADPERLLAWADRLFGRAPASWSVTMPAADFAFGAPLSPSAANGLAAGLQAVRSLLDAIPSTEIGPPPTGGGWLDQIGS